MLNILEVRNRENVENVYLLMVVCKSMILTCRFTLCDAFEVSTYTLPTRSEPQSGSKTKRKKKHEKE